MNTGIGLTSVAPQVFTTSQVGSASVPQYVFQNNNANTTSYPAIKLDRTAPASNVNDTIGSISMWADDATGTTKEWSRIQTTATNVAVGNQDATLSFFGLQNNNLLEVLNINLGSANEINSFRPIDMNNNAIRTSAGDFQIDGTTSSGTGAVVISTKDGAIGTGTGLQLKGNTLTAAGAGASAGLHLCLTINNVAYKIALLNP